MNIAFVCDSVMYGLSGAYISTLRFAELLKKRGHNVILITSRHPGTKKEEYYHGMKTYRIFSLPFPKTNKQFYMSFPKKSELKKILVKEKIDILHVVDPGPSTKISIKVAQSLGIKAVAHCHGKVENWSLWIPKFIEVKNIERLFYKFIFWMYRGCDIIISPSKKNQEILQKYNSSARVEVISNGINKEIYRKRKFSDFLLKFKLPKKPKKLLFVGRLQHEKDVTTLIKAMPYVLEGYKNVHLILVGEGPLEKEMKHLSEELGLSKNVSFIGKLLPESKDLVEAYNSADILILPSIAEIESLVIFEAMACGKPIIISDSSSNGSAIFVTDNGLRFKTKNYKDLAEKIGILLKNDKLREKMADNSFQKSKEYRIDKSVKKLEELYKSLLR